MASAGRANSLITGDKRDLFLLKKYETTAIVTISDLLSSLWHLHQFR
jgi:predicted nucleic acid-binding protein